MEEELDITDKSKSYIEIQEMSDNQFKGNFFKWLKDAKRKYKFSLIFDIFNLILSVSCAMLYIYTTYDPNSIEKNIFSWYNLLSRIYFLTDFILNMFTIKTESKISLLMYIAIEFVTSVPYILMTIVNGVICDFTSNIFMIISSLVTLRVWRVEYLSKYIQSEVNRKLYTITCWLLTLLIFSTSLINVVENTQNVGKYWLYLPRDSHNHKSLETNASFHADFFFIMTTISTLGYYSPIISVLGRLLIIILIVISLIEIPSKSSELMSLLTSKSIYSRTTYKKLDKVNFILITGNISYGSLLYLLQEYFHPDHGETERHALILLPQIPDQNIKSLLLDYQDKLFYFEGDPLKESDLKRCQFQNASTIIILCNKQTNDSNAEDSKTILQAMAIRKFLLQDFNDSVIVSGKTKNTTKMLIQLLRPESQLHFNISISKKNNYDQILCIDELKLSLIAKSCLCAGIIALVSNLITTSNTEDVNENLLKSNPWIREYKNGKGNEMYKINLDNFRGYKFGEVCEIIYSEKQIIMLGLNIESKDDGSSIILLNPYEFFLPANSDIVVYGYCLAENKTTADDVVIWSQCKKLISLLHFVSPDENISLLRRISNRSTEGLQDEEDSLDEKDIYTTDAIAFSRICHITTEKIVKSSVTLDSIDSMLIARGHIIICGISHNFIEFIKPLRGKHLPKSECPAIVILCKELPDDKLWSTIAFFDEIYLIQGDSMNKSDLKRAGIRYAKRVVILAPNIHEILQFTYNRKKQVNDDTEDWIKQITARKLTREEVDLLDSKTIFKYNMISKMKKDIFIIVELISPKNVSFLYNKGRTQNDEYKFIKSGVNIDGTASFASGEVYLSSIMDNLIIQEYYNPSLLSVLKKLILGEDQSSYKKLPLCKYKDIVSANLYLINIPNELKNETDNFSLKPEEYFKLTFNDAYKLLLKRKIVLIGVYKAYISNYKLNSSDFYYVVTAPEPSFILNSQDKLFVLSQNFPSDELFIENTVEKLHSFEDNIFKQYENSQFQNVKKKDDKKENKRLFDEIGEQKINGVNEELKEILDNLKDLKSTINKTKDKINSTISDAIYDKISQRILDKSLGNN